MQEVAYFQQLFYSHEIVSANGSPSESMLAGEEAMSALTAEARAEIKDLFPEVAAVSVTAFTVPSRMRQNRFMYRLAKNQHTFLHTSQRDRSASI